MSVEAATGSAFREVLITDIFTFPYQGEFVLYAPLRRLVMLANSSAVSMLARIRQGEPLEPAELSAPFLDTLREARVLGRPGQEGSADVVRFAEPAPVQFRPTELILFLTTDCRQRCKYCYASGGHRSRTMRWEVARAAIDLVLQNTLDMGANQFAVGFHGGGEPTFHWELLTQCTRYAQRLAREHHLQVQLSVATGGVLLPSRARWIAENMSGGSSISLDGPPEFQNLQRPVRGGFGSADIVFQTLKIWDAMSFQYGIRTTVTPLSVRSMPDIVSFIAAEFRPVSVQFEPLAECGRCRTSGMAAPEPDEFATYYAIARAHAEELGITLTYSGARTNALIDSYCGGGRPRYLWVTHDGWVTACFEVLERSDPRSEAFFFGRYDEESRTFRFDLERLDLLQQRRVQNLASCADCIAKWHCAGDCMAKAASAGDMLDPTRLERCVINQKLTMSQLIAVLSKEGQTDEP